MAGKYNHDPELVKEIAGHYKAILSLIGEDPDREGLVKTPVRAAKALLDITHGYRERVGPAGHIRACRLKDGYCKGY